MKIPRLTSRTFTCGLIDLAEQGVLDWEDIARRALDYMSEDDVQELAESEWDIEAEED